MQASEKKRQVMRRGHLWRAASSASEQVPRWLAWRWLFAQEYNRHEPQTTGQQAGKARAGGVAGAIVEAMGGALMAPVPPALTASAAWKAWLAAARKLEPDQRVAMLRVLLDRHLTGSAAPAQHTELMQRKAHQLSLLLGDMAAQERARAAGWRPGNFSKPHKGATRRRKA